MFKRLLWLIIGAGFGFGVSFWLMRFVRETVDRYTPERVSADLGDAIRALGQDLRARWRKAGRASARPRPASEPSSSRDAPADPFALALRQEGLDGVGEAVGDEVGIGDQLAAGHDPDVEVAHVGQHRDVEARRPR